MLNATTASCPVARSSRETTSTASFALRTTDAPAASSGARPTEAGQTMEPQDGLGKSDREGEDGPDAMGVRLLPGRERIMELQRLEQRVLVDLAVDGHGHALLEMGTELGMQRGERGEWTSQPSADSWPGSQPVAIPASLSVVVEWVS